MQLIPLCIDADKALSIQIQRMILDRRIQTGDRQEDQEGVEESEILLRQTFTWMWMASIVA